MFLTRLAGFLLRSTGAFPYLRESWRREMAALGYQTMV
jgi:hypothetical protein